MLEVARSRRLGIAGEVSVWQIPENSVNHARVNTAATFCLAARFFFFAQHFGRGVFLWEKRSMIDFPIRSYWTATNDRVSNKELRPPGICLGATWAGIFCYTEIADLWRLGFIYTEFADAWRLDFIYTEIADTLVVEGLARRRHCFCFIPDASKISSSFSCRFFLS